MSLSVALRPSRLVLALSLVFPQAFSSAAVAQEADGGAIPAVRVTAVKAQGFMPNTVEAGSFRGSDVMDVPSTVNVITRDVLELQGGFRPV
jgi:iron complex outermembrane receptor protein